MRLRIISAGAHVVGRAVGRTCGWPANVPIRVHVCLPRIQPQTTNIGLHPHANLWLSEKQNNNADAENGSVFLT